MSTEDRPSAADVERNRAELEARDEAASRRTVTSWGFGPFRFGGRKPPAEAGAKPAAAIKYPEGCYGGVTPSRCSRRGCNCPHCRGETYLAMDAYQENQTRFK